MSAETPEQREYRIAKIARRVFVACYSRSYRSAFHAQRVEHAFAAAEAFVDEADQRAAALPPPKPARFGVR